jgi:hypothetical protein
MLTGLRALQLLWPCHRACLRCSPPLRAPPNHTVAKGQETVQSAVLRTRTLAHRKHQLTTVCVFVHAHALQLFVHSNVQWLKTDPGGHDLLYT